MALVGGDVGVDGRGDESARLGGDDEGLRPRPLLWFPHGRLPLQLGVQVFSLETETEAQPSVCPQKRVVLTACRCHLQNYLPAVPTKTG